MGHKNRSEDMHNGQSKNSRKGTHRRRGSSGARYEYFGNSTGAGHSCPGCYHKWCGRLEDKAAVINDLRVMFK